MTFEEIIAEWLKEHGYTGLCNPDLECACSLKDLMPCSQPGPCCEAGHEHKDGEVYLKKEGEYDE